MWWFISTFEHDSSSIDVLESMIFISFVRCSSKVYNINWIVGAWEGGGETKLTFSSFHFSSQQHMLLFFSRVFHSSFLLSSCFQFCVKLFVYNVFAATIFQFQSNCFFLTSHFCSVFYFDAVLSFCVRLTSGLFSSDFFPFFFNIPNEKQQALIKTISPCHSLVICPRPIKLKPMIDVHVRNPSVIRQCFNQVRRWKFHDNKEKLKSWFNSNRIRNLLSGFLDPKNK